VFNLNRTGRSHHSHSSTAADAADRRICRRLCLLVPVIVSYRRFRTYRYDAEMLKMQGRGAETEKPK